MEILKDIPSELNLETLLEKAHITPGTSDAKEFAKLLEKAKKIAKPKALYRESYIEHKGEDRVTVNGVTFESRILRKNLEKAERVFPYIATCGNELDQINISSEDFLKQFWLDTIKATVLGTAMKYLDDYLHRKYALGKTSAMNPGSGDVKVWPIEQQKELFSLFGDVEALIGVRLTGTFLMVPNKTVSGILFPTEIDFRSCQLCHRENCPSRSAPFNKVLWESIQSDISL